MVAMELKPKDKVAINFLISKDIDQKFRTFLAQKYGGYHRGSLSKEMELALNHFIDEQTGTNK